MVSMSASRNCCVLAAGSAPSSSSSSLSLKMLSMTLISVDVVSAPTKAAQSFAMSPAPRTSDPRFTVPAIRGTCSKLASSSRSSTDVRGCTIPPWLVNTQYDPTRALPQMVWRKTSTPRTSAMISSVCLSMSVWTRATWSLQEMQLPSADKRSSTRCTTTLSGKALRRCCSSWSPHVFGTRRPRLLPAQTRPRKRHPEMDAWTTGMCSPSSDWSCEK
mmetsp:Transcript_18663/g.63047  ORF Transcript_18663/g.63047 Transcript_18663/m.63047 type:complete len:217 (-) Transcript_18663:156-806(-)